MSRFSGRTVVCIASGPSLTVDDCQAVQASGLPVIVINSSWRLAPFADVLLAGDGAWWDANAAEVTIPAHKVCCGQAAARKHRIEYFRPVRSQWNSGMASIWYAQDNGADRVILLGFDCKAPNGKRHWHGDHPKTKNPSLSMITGWAKNFARMPVKIPVVNASRDTAITRWPLVPLEQALPKRIEAVAA
jgi:hypothetical protein